MKDAYAVAVLGFEQTERIVLSSIFGLSARRTPKFVQAPPGTSTPDLYLVDAANAGAIGQLRERNAGRKVPAIMVGDSDHGTGWPVLNRPLQWTRLFKAFETAVGASASGGPVGAPAAQASAQPARPAPQVDPFAPTMRITPAQRAAVTPPPPPAPAPAARPAGQTGRQPAAPVAGTMDRDNVMVVDDSPAVREFMRTKLEPFAFKVDFAASGEEAIGLTAGKHYTCIFLDVIMPGIDGYQVCKMIKARKSVKATAVVMLTSKSSPFDKIRGAMAGCDAYLTKPVDEERLLEVIAKFLPTMQA